MFSYKSFITIIPPLTTEITKLKHVWRMSERALAQGLHNQLVTDKN